eukprot:3872883-Pyramimonas_sp.AAC.2
MAFLATNANLARTLPEKTSGSAKYAATASGSVDISFGSTAGAMRAIGISAAAMPERVVWMTVSLHIRAIRVHACFAYRYKNLEYNTLTALSHLTLAQGS